MRWLLRLACQWLSVEDPHRTVRVSEWCQPAVPAPAPPQYVRSLLTVSVVRQDPHFSGTKQPTWN